MMPTVLKDGKGGKNVTSQETCLYCIDYCSRGMEQIVA